MTQRVGLDAVHGHPLAADLDDGDPLTEAALELLHSGDVDLLHVEPELTGEGAELVARALAEVAVAGDVEGYGRAQG